MRIASVVVLVLVGVALLVGSLASARLAYLTGDFPIGGVPIAQVAPDRPAVVTGLRAARGTAAAFAAAYAVMLLGIALGPYRSGDKGSWWVILISAAVLAAVALARGPFLDTWAGAQQGAGPFVLILIGLLLDVKRLKS